MCDHHHHHHHQQILLLSMALLRIGSLMKLISPSVLTGFVTGSGVYIFLTQSKYIWGFKVKKALAPQQPNRPPSIKSINQLTNTRHTNHPNYHNKQTAAARHGADPRAQVPLQAHPHGLGQVRHAHRHYGERQQHIGPGLGLGNGIVYWLNLIIYLPLY
jgi:hypothetical protein